ncbi:MAG: hypothetical protein ACRDYA_21990 [Egibacteraceae bacterium]
MPYVSSEEARSDLFLSAAVFLIGPVIVETLLGFVPLQRIPGVTTALRIGLPLVYTLLVPYLLIRYRKESVRDYLPKGGLQGFAFGLLLALPVVAATVLATLLEQGPIQQALPVLLVTQPVGGLLLARLLTYWLGIAGLAIYTTVKARDAFRSDPRTLRDGALEIARVLGAVAAVVVLLLLLVVPRSSIPGLLLWPLGVVGAVAVAFARLRGPSPTSRAILLTPVLLLALSAVTFNVEGFVQGLYVATLLGGIGLLFGMLQESGHSAYGVLGLALGLALATPPGVLS